MMFGDYRCLLMIIYVRDSHVRYMRIKSEGGHPKGMQSKLGCHFFFFIEMAYIVGALHWA